MTEKQFLQIVVGVFFVLFAIMAMLGALFLGLSESLASSERGLQLLIWGVIGAFVTAGMGTLIRKHLK